MNPLEAAIYATEVNHEDYQHPQEYYVENFLNNSLGFPNKNTKEFGQLRRKKIRVDPKTEYATNNFGFRDKNWDKVSEILAVGCSNTYGIGVPIEGSWPKILEKLTNKNVHNLSRPGISIQELVFQMFAYFEKFGNPEIIVCLFPDPFRIVVPVKPGLVGVGKEISDSRPVESLHLDKYNNTKISDRKKYLKIPYDYEDIFPMEFPLYFSMRAIHMLEQYCRTNKIKLIWSSWHPLTLNVFEQLKEITFTNFVNSKEFTITNERLESICHTTYPEVEDRYFSWGQDIETGKDQSHIGVHKHLHIAEEFYKELNK